jgi:hypothetical protein
MMVDSDRYASAKHHSLSGEKDQSTPLRVDFSSTSLQIDCQRKNIGNVMEVVDHQTT